MKKLLFLALIPILLAGFYTGCKKDKGLPPVLPPPESMIIDFSNFTSQKKGADLIPGQKGTENSNWNFAASVAGIWKVIINTTLVVPVTAFKLAVGQNPVYLSAKTWQWSYSATVVSDVYKAKLTGQIGTSDIQWNMYITKEGTGAFTDYLWFEGTSKLDGTSGQWILNQSSQTPGTLLQIDWTKTGSSVAKIKYTYVKNDPFLNSYIEYGLTANALNAYYTINYFNGLVHSDVNVEWNSTTLNGRVKCLEYLGDTNWYCWDSNKINILCP
jgi:hypothetical protein